MEPERCDECGFDGGSWDDAGAVDEVADLPARWAVAIADLTAEQLGRRPFDDVWSISEYTDHVRETTYGMRFLIGLGIDQPGIDVGSPPDQPCGAQAKDVDVRAALRGFGSEVEQLVERFRGLSTADWSAWVVIGGDRWDAAWIIRHLLHDVTHHLGDVARLRAAMAGT